MIFATLCVGFVCAIGSGAQLGPYVDNEVPHRCQDGVVPLLASQSQPVFYGVAQNETGFHCKAGGIKLQEWYPFVNGADVFGPPPSGDPGYIIQWWFHWDGSPPPTMAERLTLLDETTVLNPRYVIVY